MNLCEEFLTKNAIVVAKRSAGVVSGSVSVIGAHKAVIRFIKGNSSASTNWSVRHASGSTTLFASATAFSTALAVSAATSGQKAVVVDLLTCKGYIVVKQSTITNSHTNGVIVDLYYNRAVPPSSTQGFIAAPSFVTP